MVLPLASRMVGLGNPVYLNHEFIPMSQTIVYIYFIYIYFKYRQSRNLY